MTKSNDRVGERHVGGIGVEQRSVDTGRRSTGALPAVVVADETVEQHIGTPVRLVAAADVEHQSDVWSTGMAIRRRWNDRSCDTAATKLTTTHRWNSRTRPSW